MFAHIVSPPTGGHSMQRSTQLAPLLARQAHRLVDDHAGEQDRGDVREEEQQRAARLVDHARQVRDHMTKLASKNYWSQFDDTPEFVVMFLHDESSWLAALDIDPSLHELALSNNVIPASPTNLIGLLRAVHYGWQQESIAEGARQISDLGRELYKRLSTMGAHISKLGRSLDGAVKSYNETVGSLERQVLPQARRFRFTVAPCGRYGAAAAAKLSALPPTVMLRGAASPQLVSGGACRDRRPCERPRVAADPLDRREGDRSRVGHGERARVHEA